MIYKNKTWNIPSIEQIIASLCNHNIDIVLIGSEAGKLYGLCDSIKDIDFMINTSEENMKKMFVYLQESFSIKSYQEFSELDRIVLRSFEKKHIEFIQKSNFIKFENIRENALFLEYYNHKVWVINVHDYVEYIKKYKTYLEKTHNKKEQYIKKINSYTSVINNYNKQFH